MKSLLVLCLIVFKTLSLTFGDARPLFFDSSSDSLVSEQTIHGTVSPIRTTEDVPTRIKHINRKTDQSLAKATVDPTTTPSQQIEKKNSTKSDSLNATHNQTGIGATPEPTTEKIVVRHIPRIKRDTYEVTMPFNFDTLHMPCEFDLSIRFPQFLSNHCLWLYNNRFQSKEFFRSYMLTKGEAFFFGQYNERLRRFEEIPSYFNG